MDRLTSMGVFVKAADLGSFAAAAEILGLSPQMVAKHVAFLEGRLGATLLARTTRRQSLTDIGRAYYDRCKAILADAEAAELLARDMRTRPTGLLRVNAPVNFGTFTLAPFITRYLADYPDMRIDLTLSDRYVDLLEDGYDVAIRIGDVGDTSLAVRPLGPYRLIAAASPAYLAARGTPRTPTELEAHDCLAYAYWSPSIPSPWRFSRDGRTEIVEANGRLRSNDWNALLRAVQEGFGITLGPESVLEPEIQAGRLVRLLPDYEGPVRPMHVLTSAARRPTASLRSFVDALAEEFGERAPFSTRAGRSSL